MKDYKDYIKEDESIDDLEIKGLHIIQKKKGFRFGIDAVLLSDFAKARDKDRVLDLCSGSGIIALLISAKSKSPHILGIEIQDSYHDMAKRSVAMNGLDDRIKMIREDIKNFNFFKNIGSFDLVTVNPPYKKTDSGIKNPDDSLSIARHEILLTLDDVVKSASLSLKDNGRLCMVHRPERLIEIIDTFRKYKIEPKRIKLVSPNSKKEPNIILIEGFKGQKPNLKFEPLLRVYEDDGTLSQEIKDIYGDKRH